MILAAAIAAATLAELAQVRPAAAAVRVVVLGSGFQAEASGVVLGGNGESAVVLTARHALEGAEEVRVYRPGAKGYRARVIAQAEDCDLAAVLVKDTGDFPVIELAASSASSAILAGFGRGDRVKLKRGELAGRGDRTALYTFDPVAGDSGGGVFTEAGRLQGIVWGRSSDGGAAVSLDSPRIVASSGGRGLKPSVDVIAQAGQSPAQLELEALTRRVARLELLLSQAQAGAESSH